VHVVLRTVAAVGNLRTRFAYRAIREATLTTARRQDFRIVHASIQRTHIHLIVEADNKTALASGMQGFQISAARHLNAALGARTLRPHDRRPPTSRRSAPRRRGTVFPDRYHATIITSPRQARHALAYVLVNFRKHEEDRAQPMSSWTIDWFSTAAMFPGWIEYGDAPSCGAALKRTIRSSCTSRGRGCCARDGGRMGRSRIARFPPRTSRARVAPHRNRPGARSARSPQPLAT
jgi:REP element-mobilizing transposase RayT